MTSLQRWSHARPWFVGRPFRVAQPGVAPATARIGEIPADTPVEQTPPASPLTGVRWSLVYAALLLYVFIITTYQLGVADLAMLAALVGLALQRDGLRVAPLLVWLALFLAWSAVGYLTTPYPSGVWDWLVTLTKLWLVTLVMTNALRTRSQVRLFTIVFLGCFALYPLRGALFNFYLYKSNLFGRAQWNFIYENPNDLAALALLQLSLNAGVLVTEAKGWVRNAARVGAGLLPLLILMTQSRGGFVALCVFVVCTLFGPRAHRDATASPGQRRRARLLSARRIVAGLLVGIIVVLAAPTGVWQRVAGLKGVANTDRLEDVDREGSAHQRYQIWRVATRMIEENPVTGIGLGEYENAHAVYALDGSFDPIALGHHDAHSTFLRVASETGLPGLAIFVALVLTTVSRAERMRRRCRTIMRRASAQLFYLEIGLLAFFIAGIFGSFAYLSFLYIHLALLWVLSRITGEELAALHRGSRMVLHAPPVPQAGTSTGDRVMRSL